MDEGPLSARERQALAEIEEALERDEPLARRLRTMRGGSRLRLPALSRAHSRSPGGRGGHPALGVTVLGALTLALLVLAVVTEAPVLIWVFAAVWVLTLLALGRLLLRWARRRPGGPPKTG
ncbi:hypothetical protein [Streptomyces sp. NPDC059491]|uniref:hypothetical protein n=1 Tax=Streptomyces sp. NPDC059491 TaxID=3346850 RepID=UPI00367F7D7C